MINRRNFLRSSVAAALTAGAPMGWVIREAGATPACGPGMPGGTLGCSTGFLSDPAFQFQSAGFTNLVPDAMAPGFKYVPGANGEYTVRIQKAKQTTGLVDARGKPLKTWVYGYGDPSDGLITWPGRTFEVRSARAGGPASTVVNWLNGLNLLN